MLDLIYFLLIGLAAVWLAGKIMKGRRFGIVGNLVIGVIGAILGGFFFRLVGLLPIGFLYSSFAPFPGRFRCRPAHREVGA